MQLPLEDVRILDFSQWVAGPEMGLLLSYLGAEVIKVESHERPDPTREKEQTERNNPESSILFSTMNVNKLSVTIDLKKRTGVELALRLATICDAVTENFRPGVMDKLGLSYEQFKAVNDRIVMVSVSGYGQTGPDAENVAFASVFGAVGGLSELTGYTDGPPMELRLPMDTAGGTSAAMALLAGLAYRDSTGRGTHVDFSASAMVSAYIGEYLLDYAANGRIASRKGNRDEAMAPHNCYRCQGTDRWISIAVGSETEWQALCRTLGKIEWLSDERFEDGFRRYQHQAELDQLIVAETRNYAAEDLMAKLQEAGVAAGLSASGADLCDDPHLRSRQTLLTLEHPVIGPRVVIGPPWKMSGVPEAPSRPAAFLGQHNEYVFGNLLGLSRGELEALAAEGVIANRGG